MVIGVVNAESKWNFVKERSTREKGPFGGKIVRHEKCPLIGTNGKLFASLECRPTVQTTIFVSDKAPDQTGRFWRKQAMEENSHIGGWKIQ